MRKQHPNIGDSLDDLLENEGILEEVEAKAMKEVLSWQLAQYMKANNVTKTEMAQRMNTSRSSLDRILDPENPGLTLMNVSKIARAIGKKPRLVLD